MNICDETTGTICEDAIIELRTVMDSDLLAPADASYADAHDRWSGRGSLQRSVPNPARLDADRVLFAPDHRSSDFVETTGGEQGTVPIAFPAGPARRIGPSDLMVELERFMQAGRPELAAERLVSAILTAGLAATFADHMTTPRQSGVTSLNAAAVLTRREREVVALVAAGRTNRSIADELFIAQSTVERHVANMLNKLGFNSRTQIAAWAVANGLASAA